MRYSIVAALSLAVLQSTPALAWGPTGHRITGVIAEQSLSGVARANIRILLGDEDLAEAATWPDDMRSDPSEFWQKAASPWHYVTVRGDEYRASDAPRQGDAIMAISRFTTTLRDPTASKDDKRLAIRFSSTSSGTCTSPFTPGERTNRARAIAGGMTFRSPGSAGLATSIRYGTRA